jgi:hypothetical protein
MVKIFTTIFSNDSSLQQCFQHPRFAPSPVTRVPVCRPDPETPPGSASFSAFGTPPA